MKILIIAVSVLMLSACATTSDTHKQVIDVSQGCLNGAKTITHSSLDDGETTIVECQ